MTDDRIADLWNRADPDLEPAEKETTIRWAKPDDAAVVHTDEAGVGRRLIRHDDSTVESVTVLRADDTRAALEPEEVREDDEVVGVRVRLPVAALSVKGSPRSSPQHAAVVSDAVLADGGRPEVPVCPDCDLSSEMRKRRTKEPDWACYGCGWRGEEPIFRPAKRSKTEWETAEARALIEADAEEVP